VTGLELTVVVPTFERSHGLAALFEALDSQTLDHDRFEVVIVDDASTDETDQVLRRLAGEAGFHVTVARLNRNGGQARARNHGLDLASGEIIAFTDDDCLPQPGWLAAGLAEMRDGAAVVVGEVQPPPGSRIGPFTRVLRVTAASHFQTANVFYRREDLLRVGGFDVEFRAFGGEDTELGYRVVGRDRSATFSPLALVYHPVRPDRLRVALALAARWIDLPLVVKRHPWLRDRLAHRRIFWKPSHQHLLMSILALFIGPAWWPGFALMVPFAIHRVRTAMGFESTRDRARSLLGGSLVDLVELLAMVRGSIRHRTLLL